MEISSVQALRAIDALRSGVPNRDAVRSLGTTETALIDQFSKALATAAEGRAARGIVVAGGFGTGKSHLLTYLKQLALERNFVVSFVVVGKETTVFDAERLLQAALEAGEAPDSRDDLVDSLVDKISETEGARQKVNKILVELGVAPLVQAHLHLLQHARSDPQMAERVARFLRTGEVSLSPLKQALKNVGAHKMYAGLKALKADEKTEARTQLLPHLIRCCGYAGWLVLLDECELISRYGIVQRARSYGRLARWLGIDLTKAIPGVATVAAFTDDFVSETLHRRNDATQVPGRLANASKDADRGLAEPAKAVMRMLEKDMINLPPPTAAHLQRHHDIVRSLYQLGYDWVPNDLEIGPLATNKTIRLHIKSWITSWDIERLYGAKADLVTEVMRIDLSEDHDFEQVPVEEPEAGDEAHAGA